MLREEFESLIGKEVEYETYEMYNNMYSATPEYVTKQDFVKMLNIDAIPESAEAILRRTRQTKLKEEMKQTIKNLQARINFEKNTNIVFYTRCVEEAKEMGDKKEMDYWKHGVDSSKASIRKARNQIKEIKLIYNI